MADMMKTLMGISSPNTGRAILSRGKPVYRGGVNNPVSGSRKVRRRLTLQELAMKRLMRK